MFENIYLVEDQLLLKGIQANTIIVKNTCHQLAY